MDTIQIDFAGRSFRLQDSGGADQVARHIADGTYELPLPLLMMEALVRVEGSFIDVGANSGVYTVMAAAFAPGRKIIAFEPLPAIVRILKDNLEANGLTDRVELHEVALSAAAGTAQFYLPDPSHGLVETSASLEREFQRAHSVVEVPVKRLDDIDVPDTIGVIKVDIEGHEYAFLRGARDTIMRDRPIIFAEVLGPARRATIGAFLHGIGYLDFRLRADMAILDPEVQFDHAAWNHAFVPAERLASFKTMCDACGLPLLRQLTLS